MSHPKQTKQHTSFEHLPGSALVRANQLVGTVLPFSAATLWRKVREGQFPQPIKVSDAITAWRVRDIRAWLINPAYFNARKNAGSNWGEQ
jgi:prophage regulatory protein